MAAPRRIAGALAVALLFGAAAPAEADEPDTGYLIAAGLGMAPISYALGVTLHEGSHAVAAKLMGLEVTQLRLIPGRYGPQRRFYFGYTRVSGHMSGGQRIFFWLAPKITDAVFFGGYVALLFSGALPENRYGRLAFTVAATGFWVDFSKDVVSFNPGNDVIKVYDKLGLEGELERLPLRLGHLALAAAGSYVLYRGYTEVFEDDPAQPVILPLLRTRL